MALFFASLMVSLTALLFWSFFLSMMFLFFLWVIGYGITSMLGVNSELLKTIGGIVFVFLVFKIGKMVLQTEEQK